MLPSVVTLDWPAELNCVRTSILGALKDPGDSSSHLEGPGISSLCSPACSPRGERAASHTQGNATTNSDLAKALSLFSYHDGLKSRKNCRALLTTCPATWSGCSFCLFELQTS